MIPTLAYGGNIAISAETITVQPRDAVQYRVYSSQVRISVVIRAGKIKEIPLNASLPASPRSLLITGLTDVDSVIVSVETLGTTRLGSVFCV